MYMNEKPKSSNKLKIILFAISAVIILFLILNLISLTKSIFYEINKKHIELKCKDLKADIKILFKDDSILKLEILNNDFRMNITYIEIPEYNFKKEIFIKKGESYKITLNLTNTSNIFYVILNNCTQREVRI